MTPFAFIVGSLAIWRLSHALVKENGPLMLFARLRARLARSQERSGGFFDMISCVHCTSVWIALITSIFVSPTIFHWIGYSFAMSAIAMIIETLFAKKLDSLTVVTRPAANDKVLVRGGSTPKKRNNVVSNPNSSDRSATVKTDPTLSS